MKPINIYALTRISDTSRLERLERQMSGRTRYLKIKQWEIEGLRQFCDRLEEVLDTAADMDFYYSFTMPKLGKEFDLLRINDNCVVNVELKSGNVTDDTIRRQLMQNRYYLALLGKNMHFYTYISKTDRLVRLSHGGRLLDTKWERLADVLAEQKDCYTDSIEEYFKEEKYLISPLVAPERFLRQEYFLTAQQKDIKNKILKTIQQKKGEMTVQGFTGLPGTGKTILLYDIAMRLSWSEKVCVLHFGSHEAGLEQLNERLKRVDFYYCQDAETISIGEKYSAILVDEGHRISAGMMEDILGYGREWRVPVVFTYDREESIASEERRECGAELIEKIPGYIKYCLTNRIRMNKELSSFISRIMSPHGRSHRRDYSSVSVAFAKNNDEAEKILHKFQEEGYIYIWDSLLGLREPGEEREIEMQSAICKEFDKVVMLVDESFVYNAEGYLRCACDNRKGEDFRVKNLFHGLSRAKKKIAVVVRGNEDVFDELLYILQGRG